MIGNVLSPVFKYSAPVKNDTFTFAMCARLMEKKRVNHVVSAVSILKERGIDVKVNIIGDGPMGEALKAQAKELSVDDRIVFHGNVSREEVYRLVCESDALVHASVVETFGVVYIEAFAAGRPVVSAKNGGACELINDENGILCEPDDPTALADAIAQEAAIEELVKAKGFADCVAYLTENGCQLVVKAEALTPEQNLQILDIVTSQASVAAQNVSIVAVK